MDQKWLIMKWKYNYDKEGTWFDEEEGEEQYELFKGASYKLPHIREKCLEIRSVTEEDGIIEAEIYVDYKTYTVRNDKGPVTAHASYSYSVAGDSVHQSLSLSLTILS